MTEDQPGWLSSFGSALASGAGTVSRFGANTLAIALGSPVLPFPMQSNGSRDPLDPTAWSRPERYEMARQVVPDSLPLEEQQARMTRLYHSPFKDWPRIFHDYRSDDRHNAVVMQTPEYQALYQQGGPDALRMFGMPLPPQVLAAQDAPLSAEAQARGETAPSLPYRTRQDVLPPIPPEELVKRFSAQTQLDAMNRPGAEGALARSSLAKVPPPLRDAAEMVDSLGQLAQSRGYVPEVSVDNNGVSVKLSKPGQQAFEGGMGSRRAQYTPLGGGGTRAASGQNYTDLGNGVVVLPDGTLAEKPAPGEFLVPPGKDTGAATAGTSPAAPTPTPAAEPMRGQDAAPLNVNAFPDASAADFQGLEADRRAAVEFKYKQQWAEWEQKLKGRTLTDQQRTQMSKIAAARAFVEVFRDYSLHGTENDQYTPAGARFGSTLPKERVRGLPALGESLRQSEAYQKWDADPFLFGFKGLQAVARPLLLRNLGDDSGNIGQQEGKSIDALTGARSQPEVEQAASLMLRMLDSREKEALKGKDVPEVAPSTNGGTRSVTLPNGKTVLVTD